MIIICKVNISINNVKNEERYSDLFVFSECPLSTSAKMFYHLIEARHSLAFKPKYFQPVSLNKEFSASYFNQDKSQILRNIRSIENNHGMVYILGPSLVPKVEHKTTFSICVCGRCTQQFKSLRKRMPRPRV